MFVLKPKSITLIFLINFLGICLLFHPAMAVSPFQSTMASTYVIDQDGLATVNVRIDLTNQEASTFASQYSVTFGSNRLKNITAQSLTGQTLSTNVDATENQTVINLHFDHPVVGKGKTQSFTLSFQDPDAAQKVGNIVEINLPKLQAEALIDTYQVTLLVPKYFGQPSLVSPKQFTVLPDEVYTKLFFSGDQINHRGITAQFGDRQIYTYTLGYHLQNTTVTPIETQIALPPDTPYQQNYLDFLSIPPLAMKPDLDGNWIATYKLEPKAHIDITAQGKIVTYIKPTIKTPEYNQHLQDYLYEQPYWPVNDEQVKTLAKNYPSASSINEYLVSNFAYDYQRLDNQSTERLGATQALNHPDQALCLEFTDAFITLSRAAGIPARLLTGYAYTENSHLRPLSLVQDVLHAWPEYYEFTSSSWHQIDPTWENTTGGVDYFNQLDLNHVVFAIQGIHSDQPFPAGFYKLESNGTKDVNIQFSTVLPQDNLQFTMSFIQPTLTRLGLAKNAILKIDNHSAITLYNPQPDLTSHTLSLTIPAQPALSLLPYSSQTYPVKWQPKNQGIVDHQVEVKMYGNSQTLSVRISPFGQIFTWPVLALASCLFLGLSALFTRRILVSRRPSKRPLYR